MALWKSGVQKILHDNIKTKYLVKYDKRVLNQKFQVKLKKKHL